MFLSRISRLNTISQLSPSLSRAIFLTLQTRRRFSSSGLHDRYTFTPPPSLSPPEPSPRNSNPNPSIRKPSEAELRRERKKNHLHPPSLTLDRLGTFRPWRSNLPFDFRHSYTEISRKDRPIGLREPKYSPFGPGRLDREWTGVCALAVDPKVKSVEGNEESAESEAAMAEKRKRMREKIQGKELTRDERSSLVESYRKGKTKRQINLGRDGLTHNMLSEIHNHWKSAEAVRIKCQGVPTVDMDNICYQLEDKTCGKIIFKHSCILMLYRGRHYTEYRRPSIPLMLWKPHAPIFPKLIKPIIEGLTKEETTAMRKRGLASPALTKLAKNGYYGNLVLMVRDAFLFSDLVRIDCEGLEKSDYRKIGAKLKDLVPCIPVIFRKEQIVIWRGNDYKPPESEIFLDQLKSRDEVDSESSTHDELMSKTVTLKTVNEGKVLQT